MSEFEHKFSILNLKLSRTKPLEFLEQNYI